MSSQNRNTIWYLGISTVLALLATITSATYGVLSATLSLVPQLLVLAVAEVAGIDIDIWRTTFHVWVFVAAFPYYLAVSILPKVMWKSLRTSVAVSLVVHVIMTLSACWYAMCQWQ